MLNSCSCDEDCEGRLFGKVGFCGKASVCLANVPACFIFEILLVFSCLVFVAICCGSYSFSYCWCAFGFVGIVKGSCRGAFSCCMDANGSVCFAKACCIDAKESRRCAKVYYMNAKAFRRCAKDLHCGA